MIFMPINSAVEAARRITQSALPDAPVVDETTERTFRGRKRRSTRAACSAKQAGGATDCAKADSPSAVRSQHHRRSA
jgi:hypothetical protein